MKTQTQHKENNRWPTNHEHIGFITKLELLPDEADLAVGWFEFYGTLGNKDWTHKNKNHWSDVRTLARAVSAKYGFGFDEDVTLRQMVPVLSAIIAYDPIAISATFDGIGLKDIIGLAKHEKLVAEEIRLRAGSMPSWDIFEHHAKEYRDSVKRSNPSGLPDDGIVSNPEPRPEPKVDIWDGWDGQKAGRMLTLPVIHGHGGNYQGFPHTDVIKCWVEKQDVPKGDKPVFLMPQKGFPKVSENMATFGEGKAEKRRRYEFNQTRGQANGQTSV